MQFIYTVNPIKHQPQWPVNDNKLKPTLSSKVVFFVGISMFAVIGVGICVLGVFSMTIAP